MGDTKEIAYCGTYGFYGTPALSPSPDPITSQPTAPSVPFDALLMTLVAVLGLAIAISAIVLKKQKRTVEPDV